MQFVQSILRHATHAVAACGFGLLASVALASPSNPVNGTDYRSLDQVQQTETAAGKVEVTEFFWYGCPHCNALEPALEAWAKKNAGSIVFKRVPVAFRESFVTQQKLYYALEAMGKIDTMQQKIFHAIHVDRQSLDSEAAIVDFVVKNGIDKQKFLDLYNSFGVQTKARRASQLQEAYKIDGVPTLAIDGRYLTSPSIVGASLGRQPEEALQVATFQVADYLVAKSLKEKQGAGAASTAASKDSGKKK